MLCCWKEARKIFKNVDHMMISNDVATVREFMFCKGRVSKGCFCNCLRKNWPTFTSSPHWTTTKYWIPSFVPPTRISENNSPHWHFSFDILVHPFTKKGGGYYELLMFSCHHFSSILDSVEINLCLSNSPCALIRDSTLQFSKCL